MSAIFLIFVTIAIIIFFWNFLRLKHFYTDKKMFHTTVLAYVFLICGMLGFTLDFINLKKTSSLKIAINANLPDLIRAFADFLYPLGGILILFWFLPQLFSFLKDHRLSVPILQAFRGHNNNLSYREISKKIEDLPNYDNMHEAQKEIINIIEKQLSNFPADDEKNLLLNYGTIHELKADCEMIYNRIYGTQIQALQALKNNELLNLNSFYEKHKQEAINYSNAFHTDFNEWIKFLINTNLVESLKENRYTLTHKGDYVLKYFLDNNLFLDKAF